MKDLIKENGSMLPDEEIYRALGNLGNVMGEQYTVKKFVMKYLKYVDKSLATLRSTGKQLCYGKIKGL